MDYLPIAKAVGLTSLATVILLVIGVVKFL